jgi:proteasome assembly chaperone (PAC2) family protein
MKFNFYGDPGHGWVKVPYSLIKKLGIEKKISFYSYYRKGNVYLEEDCDFRTFHNAMQEKKQITITEQHIKSFHTDRSSKIRGYDYYKQELAE